MARIPRFLRTQTGLRLTLAGAALAVWGVTWISTLIDRGEPVPVATHVAQRSPTPSPSPAPAIVVVASTPTPTPAPTPTRRPTPRPTPTPTRTPSPSPTPTPATCTVAYRVNSTWSDAFSAMVTIGNPGSTAIDGWTLAFTFPGRQTITMTWNGVTTQRGSSVSIKNTGSDGHLAPGGSVVLGFQADLSGSNVNPSTFTLNGITCRNV